MSETASHAPNRVFFSQAGNVHLNGAQLYDQLGNPLPQLVAITYAKGLSSNICLVSFQVTDPQGIAIGRCVPLDVWLSDAPTGIGLTATTASGAVAAGASGTDFGDLTSKKAKRVLTDATGLYILSITDTANTGFYPCCALDGVGEVIVGAQLTSGNYD